MSDLREQLARYYYQVLWKGWIKSLLKFNSVLPESERIIVPEKIKSYWTQETPFDELKEVDKAPAYNVAEEIMNLPLIQELKEEIFRLTEENINLQARIEELTTKSLDGWGDDE